MAIAENLVRIVIQDDGPRSTATRQAPGQPPQPVPSRYGPAPGMPTTPVPPVPAPPGAAPQAPAPPDAAPNAPILPQSPAQPVTPAPAMPQPAARQDTPAAPPLPAQTTPSPTAPPVVSVAGLGQPLPVAVTNWPAVAPAPPATTQPPPVEVRAHAPPTESPTPAPQPPKVEVQLPRPTPQPGDDDLPMGEKLPVARKLDAPPIESRLPRPLAKSEASSPPAPPKPPPAPVKPEVPKGIQLAQGMGLPGAGSAAAIAGAAGPVGIAIAAVQAVKSAGDAFRADIEGAGAAASKLARNDLSVLGDATHKAGDAIGKINPVAGELVKTFATAATTIHKTAQAFVDRGKEIQGYSGQLTVANVQADLRRLNSDMREAQKLGPSLAKLTEQQSRAEESFKEAILPIKKFLIEKLGYSLEVVTGFIEWIKPYVEAFWKLMVTLEPVFKGLAVLANPALAATILNIGDILKFFQDKAKQAEQPAPDLDAVWDKIFNFGRGAPVVAEPDPWRDRARLVLGGQFGFGFQR